MNKLLSPGLILIALACGWMWLRAHDAAVEARALAEARADSIQVAQAQRDSLAVIFDAERAQLLDSIQTLTTQAVSLRGDLMRARRASSVSGQRLDSLLSGSRMRDSTRAIIQAAVADLEHEVQVCSDLLDNCEQRVDLLLVQSQRDSIQLTEARASTRELAERVQQLLRQGNKSPWLTVGTTVGFGTTYSGGKLYAGPSLTFGVSFKLFTIGGG